MEKQRQVTQKTLKPFSIITILCLLTAMAAPYSALADSPFEQMRQTTVRVLCVKPPVTGMGSGFVIGGGDYVATNWHVVACSEEGGDVAIWLSENNKVKVVVKWKSVRKDLAILKLDTRLDRPTASLALHDSVDLGDTIVAAGFPSAADREEGLQDLGVVSVTKGIISRSTVENMGGVSVKFYQVSAAINPGNSGGPLFNEYGQVIGINAQKSLVMVPVVDPSAPLGIGTQRVPLGELTQWCNAVEEAKIPAFMAFAKTVKGHWSGIIHFVESRITNGLLEGINSKVQLAKRRARGYRNTNNFINMIYFLCGKMKFNYPLYFT